MEGDYFVEQMAEKKDKKTTLYLLEVFHCIKWILAENINPSFCCFLGQEITMNKMIIILPSLKLTGSSVRLLSKITLYSSTRFYV